MLNRRLTPGVLLRQPESRDAEAVHAVIEADRERLAPWLPWAADQTLAKTQGFIQQARRQDAEEAGLTLLIEVDGTPAGMVDFHGIDRHNRAALVGYWLSAQAEGRGIMTAAVRALVEHGFGPMGLHRIEIRAGVDNHRSRAIPERLGFTLEGEARDAELIAGRWMTLAVYAKLAVDGD